ncbi:MAG: DUF1549 and DUF1553 domain-containing protein, partial [Gemmataceae bacterium]|nr:DUF1549 and DUF1553 domain-containing protein [Gemmataceae bacterium]
MHPFRRLSSAMIVAAAMASSTVRSQENVLPIGQGNLTSLTATPAKVVLAGAGQLQQLVISGQYANGGVRDLTRQASFRVLDSQLVGVTEHGLLTARSNGTTEVVAEVQGQAVRIEVAVHSAEREQPMNFTNQIVPIFSKLGCNSGACHGKSTGQNGFRLSLLGFEPWVDYEAIVREARGRRIFPAAPEASLLLRKPTGAMPHGGGRRLGPESRDYETLLRWIRAGAPWGSPTDPRVVGIAITPSQRLAPPKSALQILVTATMSDGSRRDVTADAEYTSNNPEIAEVSEGGLVETQDLPGDGAILARYLGHVAVFRVTVPQEAPLEKYTFPQPANFIDEYVYAKLKQLGLPPSDRCSDSEFLRRVHLDITGTLPTAQEAEKFLADPDPQKREKLVDELLARPTYAAYFALKWSDILRNRREVVGVPGKQERTQALHNWLRQSFLENKPYDQLVREILTAQGDYSGDNAQPPVAWFNVLRKPDVLVDDTAQVFLGTRLQCAQCHHHPYEKWSQDDYWGLAAFFARVRFADAKTGKISDAKKPSPGAARVVLAPSGQVTSPQGKVYTRPRPLDGQELTIPAEEDPRQKLVDWMVAPNNPFFAKAIVNRYWAHFFGRGIVDLPDDMRVSNPPSNPALLEALAQDFIKHKYDLK